MFNEIDPLSDGFENYFDKVFKVVLKDGNYYVVGREQVIPASSEVEANALAEQLNTGA